MKLDVATLAFISSLVFATQAIAFLIQYRVNKTMKGPGWWLLGAILQALGFFMILSMAAPSAQALAIFANPLIFTGQVCIYSGITNFLGRRERREVFASLFLAYIICYFYFIFIDNSIFGRSVVVSSSAALISTLIAVTLFSARKGGFSGSATFAASVFLAYGIVQALITVGTVFLPHLASYDDFYEVPVRVVAFIIPILGSMLWTYGLIIMVNQRLNAENLAEKEKLRIVLKEVHHRIKNNMNTMMSLLNLQAGTMKDSLSVDALEDASKRLQSMETLYEKLYQSSGFTKLSMRSYLPSLVDEILANFHDGIPIRVEKDIADFTLDADRLQPLGIIINELLTNIMKYAFRGRDEGRITISATLAANRVSVIVQDDGVGIPESVDVERSPGFGLMLVQALAAQLFGTFRMERGKGTRAVVEFEYSREQA